ncbi:MAG: dihydropteroate synthase [Flaviaesturariibacter sp.]|nr:dihydropteroate synthase [Flaviaesturariibacter sp.]
MLTINCKGRLITFEEPLVMGIINATPDSFYEASRIKQSEEVIRKAEQMLLDGATLLDVGGQSTRPGSQRVSEEEELQRVIPAVETIAKNFPLALISIDTFYAKVARYAVEAGAALVNDVSAGSIDAELIPAVAQLGVPYVLMHMQGDPQTMQTAPHYDNVVLEVYDTLNFKLAELHAAGINDIIIDPGFGFGKTIDHNFTLLSHLTYVQQLGKPVLVGISRKGTIYKTLDITAEEALNGTTALNTIALMNGAQILRVHDVKEARQAIQLYLATQKQKEQL